MRRCIAGSAYSVTPVACLWVLSDTSVMCLMADLLASSAGSPYSSRRVNEGRRISEPGNISSELGNGAKVDHPV
jgi:hypothetical protein